MHRTRAFILILLLVVSGALPGQGIRVDANNTPLNEVLIEIRDNHDIRFSFNDKLLSRYKVSLTSTFQSPEEAIQELLNGLPLSYDRMGDVFVIYEVRKKKNPKTYVLSGQILDKTSREPLPYSHIIINQKGVVTDFRGGFSYSSQTDSLFSVRASHLGYYIVDTTLEARTGHRILLTPSTIGLKEVVIRNREVERSTQLGEKAGMMKLNHKVANFLPGFGDNSVFNLPRLMPGITASGEQTNDLIIWGSYAGQSQVLFDGFPIYGLKNFNDNISAFNPLMAKDIEVFKGGYDTRFGERAGGIVNITGKNGNMLKTGFTFSINNMTLSGLVEIPLFKRGSLVIALRQTWYDLYNPSDMQNLFRRNNDADTTNDVDVDIIPEYMFRDLNIKYTTEIGRNDLFYVSLYGANDRFSYAINEPYRVWTLNKNTRETNTQSGGTLFYGKTWKSGNTSNFSFSFTNINSLYEDQLLLDHNQQSLTVQTIDQRSENSMNESILKVDNRFYVHRNHTIEASMGFYNNRVILREDTFNISTIDWESYARRMFISAQDIMSLGKKVILKAGYRLTLAGNLKKAYFEPRLSVSYQANDHWKLNAAWGLYNQFITRTVAVDEVGNYRYFWAIADNDGIPVIKASHLVFGTSYYNSGWTVNVEPFFKWISGITRYFYSGSLNLEGLFIGDSKIRGVDLFLQKEFNDHSAWVAYTLSKTEERFPNLLNNTYRRAYHDQRHELKAALLLNFDPFYFSTNYVYGSGFPVAPYPYDKNTEDLSYSRLDVSFIYKFLDRKVVGEAGLSILNLLNNQNIKYTNFERIPSGQNNSINVYAEAIPFTPTLYLKFSMNNPD